MKTVILATIALGFALVTTTGAVDNSWKTSNGKWETAGDWSGGAPSSFDSFDFITNSTSKTVTIDATTTNVPST